MASQKRPAESFFTRLVNADVRRVVDVRLNNVSQLAGFAKRNDLAYFLRELCGIDYEHRPELAPKKEMLDSYRRGGSGWPTYESRFLDLMAERGIEDSVPRSTLDEACLLCSEDQPVKCHRRLVAEYLDAKWGGLEIVHL